MHTFTGCIHSIEDIKIIISNVHLNLLPQCSRRLNLQEKLSIQLNSCYVYNPRVSQIVRWTDCKRWGPSRIFGCFVVYKSGDLIKRVARARVNMEEYVLVMYSKSTTDCIGHCASSSLCKCNLAVQVNNGLGLSHFTLDKCAMGFENKSKMEPIYAKENLHCLSYKLTEL